MIKRFSGWENKVFEKTIPPNLFSIEEYEKGKNAQ
jgi:hypothetical protein